MMKLKYSICCGLDVHKNTIVATIVISNSEYNPKSFSTINSDIQKFHDWLIENNCYHVCMESTGNIGFLFLIISKKTSMCALHILNMSRLSKATPVYNFLQNKNINPSFHSII